MTEMRDNLCQDLDLEYACEAVAEQTMTTWYPPAVQPLWHLFGYSCRRMVEAFGHRMVGSAVQSTCIAIVGMVLRGRESTSDPTRQACIKKSACSE